MNGEFRGHERSDVERAAEKDMEGKDLKGLDLSGRELEGASFRRADVRGLVLYRADGTQEKETNIRGTDWTDATFADLGPQTVFQYVNAEGASFGFSETLSDRRKRQEAAGARPTAEDSGGYHNFDGRGGNFRGSRWRNIDFGGELDDEGRPVPGYEALFTAADLGDAVFDGVSLRGIDWSGAAKLDGVVIKDPDSLTGLTIDAGQVHAVADGIRLSDPASGDAWVELRRNVGDAQALRERFGVIILEDERP